MWWLRGEPPTAASSTSTLADGDQRHATTRAAGHAIRRIGGLLGARRAGPFGQSAGGYGCSQRMPVGACIMCVTVCASYPPGYRRLGCRELTPCTLYDTRGYTAVTVARRHIPVMGESRVDVHAPAAPRVPHRRARSSAPPGPRPRPQPPPPRPPSPPYTPPPPPSPAPTRCMTWRCCSCSYSRKLSRSWRQLRNSRCRWAGGRRRSSSRAAAAALGAGALRLRCLRSACRRQWCWAAQQTSR